MKKLYLLGVFGLIFVILFHRNALARVRDNCGCQFNSSNFTCTDPTDPSRSDCDIELETCKCQLIIDPFSGATTGCYPGTCILRPTPAPSDHGTCEAASTSTGCIVTKNNCEAGYEPVFSTDCYSCSCGVPRSYVDVRGNCKENEITTALGCIPAGGLNEFAGWILGKVIFVASGIAFLLMAFGAFQIITSAGSPEKMKAGSELITSALSGLLFIILSVFLLKLIGVDILQIPGFGK